MVSAGHARQRAMWPVPVNAVLAVVGRVTSFLPAGIGCGSAFIHPDFRAAAETETARACQENTGSFDATAIALLVLATLVLAAYLLLPARMVADPPTGAAASLAVMAGLRDKGVLTDEEFTTRTAQLVLAKRPDKVAG